MRITDLARKIGLSTEELRPQLNEFGIAQNAKEVSTEVANKIVEAATKKTSKGATGEPEQELMGMFFEEAEVEEEPITETAETKTRSEEKTAEPKEKKETDTQAAKTAPSINRDQEEARARWARAKAASEKILKRKIKHLEKENVRRLTRQQEKLEAVMKSPVQEAAAMHREVKVGDTLSIRDFSEKMGVSPIRILAELLKNGVMANLNQVIDFDTAVIIGESFGCKVTRDTSAISSKDILKGNIAKLLEDDPENLTPRPPIVAVMGHVDHGKTTLLDAIRKTNVVAGESGGITQHIGAYQVEHKGRKITFLDTPGHEAFTAMRARGARATDIAIIVVAAEEGLKPQTLEAIDHAKEAGVPIVVAITKIDKPEANIERVKGELSEHELVPTQWGGKTEVIGVSGKTGQGIEELLEIVLLTNDVDPVKGNPNREAVGTVIESLLDRNLGPVVTVLVNTGTLRIGDNFIIGPVLGRVKKMLDYKGKSIKEAEPGTPVRIAGLDALPTQGVGEILQVMTSIEVARKKASEMQNLLDLTKKEKSTGISHLIGRISSGELKELKIVLKTDVEGSLEAIRENIRKIGNENTKTKIIHGGVGNVSDTDVLMAAAADGIIIAFHVKVSTNVKKLADREGVSIRQHTIIYKLLEEIEKLLNGLLDPEEVEKELGELEVRGVFFVKGKEQTVGGMVKSGILQNGANIRLIRQDKLIDEGKILSLKREKENVKEVRDGFECGLKVTVNTEKIQEGDLIRAWKIEKIKRTL